MHAYPVDRLPLHMTIALCLGIFFCGGDLGLPWRVLMLCVGAIALYACRRRDFLRRAFFIGGAFLLGFGLMASHLQSQAPLAPLTAEAQPLVYQGQVQAAVEGKSWLHMRLDQVQGQDLKTPVLVRVKKKFGDEQAYVVGDKVAFSGVLQQPETQRNPGGFDEKDFLFSRGIHYTLKANRPGQVQAPAQGTAAWLQQAHLALDASLDRHLNPDQQALVAAVLFGETEHLHEDFYAFTQRIGIIHIFSVSGLHVGFIVAFILGLAKILGRQHSPWLVLLMIPLLGVYVVLSGGSPPAMRAALMAILGLFALRLLRHKDLMVIVGVVAFGLLVASPYLFWDIGFRLSFLITFGIVYGYGAVEQMLGFLPSGFRQALALALTAELVSAPLVAWYFYIFAPLSILANLLIVPLFSVLVPVALLALVISLLSPLLGSLVFWPARVVMDTSIAMIQGLEAAIGSAHVYVGQPPLPLLIAYGVLLVLFFSGRLEAIAGPWSQGLAMAGLLILLLNFHTPISREASLTVLDVGQGSSAVSRTGQGQWLVFDAGPGRDTTAQFLRYGACNRVDAIFLSHGDADHILGLRHILRDFKVDKLLVEPTALETEPWQELAPLIARKKVDLHIIDGPGTYQVDPTCTVAFDHLYAPQADGNESQLVARFQSQGFSVLIPGDVAPDYFPQDPLLRQPVDLVLVPHHGSQANWSREMYLACQPQLAIASAGRDNRFGHPHEEVLTGLEALGIPVLQTAKEGAVTFRASPQGTTYTCFCGSEVGE